MPLIALKLYQTDDKCCCCAFFFYYDFDLFALHELKKKINESMTDLREIHSDIK